MVTGMASEMAERTRAWKQRLSLATVISFAFAIIYGPLNARNLPMVVVCLGTLFATAALIRESRGLRLMAFVLFAASVPAVFSPVDVCIAEGGAMAVKAVPIVYTRSAARALEDQGFQRNRDFIHYRVNPLFYGAKRTVVLLLPRME